MAKNLKALVTGGSGFIGSHLVEALLREGWDVRCLVRKTSSLQFLPRGKVELVIGDLDNKSSLTECLPGVDAVFHLAGRIKGLSRKDYFHTNWLGTKNLLEAARTTPASLQTFIYVSSLSAAGPSPDGHLLTEDEKPRPVSHYGESKLAAEREVARFTDCSPVVVVRPVAVYGPREREILRLLKLARRGIRFQMGRKDNFFCAVHVSDVVQAIILAAQKRAPGLKTYFVGDGRVYSWEQTFDILLSILGKKSAHLTLPWGLSRATMRFWSSLFPRSSGAFYLDKMKEMSHKYWVCDISRAQKELSFAPQFDLNTGLKETIRWYKEEGWLS